MMELSNLPRISTPLPWHEQEWDRIRSQLSAGLLPHALMLVGHQFTGKSQFALALARLLLCNQSNGSLNCGSCHACELSASGNHGDLLWVTPVDKSRVIKIEQVRGLVRFASKTAGFGLHKVIVLAPANSMNLNAFNALLKSLEEPARDTYFILVCHRLDGIPATIRSRCHLLRMGLPSKATALTWLDTYTEKREESEMQLSLADELPLLAQQTYLTGTAKVMSERRQALDALLTGSIDVTEVSAQWGEVDSVTFLEFVISDLQHRLGRRTNQQLRTENGRATFRFLQEILSLQRKLIAGANPSKQLLMDAILSKYGRCMGANIVNDNISTQYRGGVGG